MVDIRPLRGLVYNRKRFEDLSLLIAPPYDVISSSMRRELLNRSDFNIVNLSLGPEQDDGPGGLDVYTRTGQLWKNWQRDGVVTRLPEPAIWRLRERYEIPSGGRVTREGFLGLMGLENYSSSGVQRHEKTYSKPKTDRLRLLQKTRASLSPIFLVYQDQHGDTASLCESYRPKGTRTAAMETDVPVDLEISFTTDESWIERFTSTIGSLPMLIADGHHRYEAAKAFNRIKLRKGSLDSSCVLGYFVPASSQGLAICPVHRGIRSLRQLDYDSFLEDLSGFFEVIPAKDQPPEATGLRLALPDDSLMVLKLRRQVLQELRQDYDAMFPVDADVRVLETIVFRKILGLPSSEMARKEHLAYFHREDECLEAIQSGDLQMAFLLRPLSVQDLFLIASRGEILPPKSTYFFPKCPDGIVMHSFEQ